MTGMFVAALAAFQQPDAARLEEAARKSVERRYGVRHQGRRVATRILGSTLEKQGDREVVLFTDVFAGPDGGEPLQSTQERADLKRGLSLLTLKRTMQGMICTVSIADGRAAIDLAGQKRTLEVTPATIGECALHVVLAAAIPKEGSVLKVDFLEPLLDQLMKGLEIRCAAKETIDTASGKAECFRWELKWEKHEEHEGGSSTTRREDTYWVDAAGVVRRCRMGDGVEMDLEGK